MKIKNIFLLSWKKLWIVVVGGFISIILHNLISGLIGGEEAFFFILVIFVLPIYMIIAVTYSLVCKVRNKSQNISADDLEEDIKNAEKEYSEGKTISLQDFLAKKGFVKENNKKKSNTGI